MGQSQGPALERPLFQLETGADGARSPDGRLEGTYLHGLFANDGYRRAWLERIRSHTAAALDYEVSVETALDELADSLSAALDINAPAWSCTQPRPDPFGPAICHRDLMHPLRRLRISP